MLGILISSKAAYVISGPRPERETSEKAEPGLLEKVDPIPKFTVLVDDSFLTNCRVLISNMTIVF